MAWPGGVVKLVTEDSATTVYFDWVTDFTERTKAAINSERDITGQMVVQIFHDTSNTLPDSISISTSKELISSMTDLRGLLGKVVTLTYWPDQDYLTGSDAGTSYSVVVTNIDEKLFIPDNEVDIGIELAVIGSA